MNSSARVRNPSSASFGDNEALFFGDLCMVSLLLNTKRRTRLALHRITGQSIKKAGVAFAMTQSQCRDGHGCVASFSRYFCQKLSSNAICFCILGASFD